MSTLRSWYLAGVVSLLLAGAARPAAAQMLWGPHASPVWAAAVHRDRTAPAPPAARVASRTHGLAVGAVIGGLAAGFLGHRMCQAYSATGDCWGQALWWGAIGGMLGGLIGASAAGNDDPAVEDPSPPGP